MNKEKRRYREILYRRLLFLERRVNLKNGDPETAGFDRAEYDALRWALKLIEEAEALELLATLEVSNTFSTAGWLQRQQEAEEADREKRERRGKAIQGLNEEPDWDDAMRKRVPGSFESGKR